MELKLHSVSCQKFFSGDNKLQRFRNELPDPSAQPKLMTLKRDVDRFTRYTITSLEKRHKPKLYAEPDLGIPLDLLGLSLYCAPKQKAPLSPEDEELLHDDVPLTPLKKDGIRRKERPSDQGVSWLVKTQYISSLSNEGTRQSLTERQAKELREMKEDRCFLENLNNSYDDQFIVASFDGEPTADSEIFNKMHKSVRENHESRATMKSSRHQILIRIILKDFWDTWSLHKMSFPRTCMMKMRMSRIPGPRI